MTTSHTNSHRRRSRAGFTLVELLVVITIIGMLMALLIPAVGAARARTRQATCLNNMTNIAKAIISFEQSKGRYPGYVQPVKRAPDPGTGDKTYAIISRPTMSNGYYQSSPAYSNTNQELRVKNSSRISWAGVILPQMDQQSQWDMLVDPQASQAQSQVVPQAGYICPEDTDIRTSPDNAGLSYSVNAGTWDFENESPGSYINKALDPEPGRGDTADNGLFHNLSLGKVAGKASNIRDGAATTLLLSENIHKNANYNWLGVSGEQMGEQHFGMVWVVEDDQARFSYESPNALPTDEGSDLVPFYARPASAHPGGSFNVMFADGHGRALLPDIDYVVYQQLMTPNGRKCVDPDNHGNNGPKMQTFWTAAPVSESDLE